MSLISARKKKKPARPRGEPRLIGGGGGGGGTRSGGTGGGGGGGRRRKKPKSRWFWRLARKLIVPVLAVLAGFVAYICYDLPDISTIGDLKKKPSIVILAEDGKTIINSYGDNYGDFVPYNQIPKSVIDAVVATEDRNFFHHFGIDPWGLLRAMWVDLRSRRMAQGGSTITQQLAKNVFLTPDRKLKRKLQEMVLALELEHRYTKQQILAIYLNRVYMGAGSFGVDAASRRYFGHSVREVTLNEAAMLAGLLKAPSHYSPTANPDISEERASQVLINMVNAKYLTQAQADAAKAQLGDEDANYRDHGYGTFYFTDWVVGQLPEYVGEVQSDIVVTTTLNPDWQHDAEDAVNNVMDAKGKADRASQAALMAMSPDGAIRAMVGGRNYRASQFNRATQALRQPGSSFKLFVYLAALEAGYFPDSEMVDQPINVGNWHPHNDTGKYLGRITLREALAKSINSIAVQLSEAVGRGRVVDMAKRLGITSDIEADPSIALGTNEVTLFDMTRAYAHLASGGNSVLPYAIMRIDLADGHPVYARHSGGSGEVLRPTVVAMMNNMLMAVTTTGTGRGAQIGRPIAGKTGTTSDYRDAWFIGFTPQLVAGVWVGNDDTSSMKRVMGGNLPASIWHGFMSDALKGVPVADIPSQAGPNVSGNSFLPWLFGGGQQGNTQAPPGPPPGVPPEPNRRVPAQNPGSLTQPHLQPQPVPGGQAAQQSPASETEPVPEEEPTPEYDAPPSFWDKLVGGDKGKQ